MRPMVEDQPKLQEENEKEIEQTAPLREALCEPCGYGLLDSIGSEITQYISGLQDPFCVGHGEANVRTSSAYLSFFE